MNATATNKSLFRKLNPFKRKFSDVMMKRHSVAAVVMESGGSSGNFNNEIDSQTHISRISNGRASVRSLSKSYFSQTPRPSLFPSPTTMTHAEEEQELLETTTVADLIRAIELFHTDKAIAKTSPPGTPKMMVKQHEQLQQKKLFMDRLTSPRQPRKSLLTLLHSRHHSSHTIHGGPTAGDVSIGSALKRKRLNSCVTENFNDNGQKGTVGDVNPFIKQRSPSLQPPPPYTSPTSTVTSATRNTDSISSVLKRRFSVRPANLDKAPGQFHKVQNYAPTASSAAATSPTQQHQQQQDSLSSHSIPFTRKL